jgi:hypothetical protein
VGSCQGQWAAVSDRGLVVSFCDGGFVIVALWHDDAMSKRSTRIAKRDEFEKALKDVEEKLRSRRGKNPMAIAPESTGRPEGRDGESEEEVEMPENENSE